MISCISKHIVGIVFDHGPRDQVLRVYEIQGGGLMSYIYKAIDRNI